ncbi:restriction endonuclease subunit S [Mongoliibacter ruber]|uniref:Type I restriction modification DNA specificity protein n=1 Tax=Mongoliibacter ruber TaxID=1750599 RepID=A0A2T0W9E6_9BACT|nr:restriction endonuclease subunit S [Mongoliibacter ruber]PRY83338.1 type I restriction modification DNA specificity protein [Mongoliibacter ruber]
MRFKTVPIKEILFSPPTNSGLKKIHVEQVRINSDYIPVYSATKDDKFVYGWVKKDSKWKKYKNLLTWVKDGSSSGYVFYRSEEFVPYEKLKILKLKEEYLDTIDYQYLKVVIQNKLLSMGFGFGFKCSMERVMETEIKIPTNENDEFDFKVQKKLSDSYNSISKLKSDIAVSFDEFKDIKIDIDFKNEFNKYTDVPLTTFFDLIKGKATYTQKYIRNNQGDFPVYSSQTSNNGEIGQINSFDHDLECLSWTTDGIYAGTVFYRNGKFSMTTHCGALVLNDKYKDLISLKYVYLFLFLNLKDYAIGEGNKRLTLEQMKSVSILIPFDDKDIPDLVQQERIVNKYYKFHKVIDELNDFFENINSTMIEL